MNDKKINLIVGIFLFLGICCFGYFAITLGGMSFFGAGYYRVTAKFSSISGLKPNASIEIAGVKIGYVKRIILENGQAVVSMQINNKVKLESDTMASVRTKGLIGEKYIKIVLGSMDDYLKDNDEIAETEPVVELEELIGKFMYDQDSSEKN